MLKSNNKLLNALATHANALKTKALGGAVRQRNPLQHCHAPKTLSLLHEDQSAVRACYVANDVKKVNAHLHDHSPYRQNPICRKAKEALTDVVLCSATVPKDPSSATLLRKEIHLKTAIQYP